MAAMVMTKFWAAAKISLFRDWPLDRSGVRRAPPPIQLFIRPPTCNKYNTLVSAYLTLTFDKFASSGTSCDITKTPNPTPSDENLVNQTDKTTELAGLYRRRRQDSPPSTAGHSPTVVRMPSPTVSHQETAPTRNKPIQSRRHRSIQSTSPGQKGGV